MTTPNLALSELVANQSQPHVTVNAALRSLDACVQLAVISAIETGPPGSPADGDRYIVASTGTGAWTGHGGEIAYYVAASTEWRFLDPNDGWFAYDLATAQLKVFSGGSPGGWSTFSGGGGGSNAGFTLLGGTWSTAQDYAFSTGSTIDHDSGVQFLYRQRVGPSNRLQHVVIDITSPGEPEKVAYTLDPFGSIWYGWMGQSVNSFHAFRGVGTANYWDGSDGAVTNTGYYICQELPDETGTIHNWGVGEVDFASPDRLVFRALDDSFAPIGDYLAVTRTTGAGLLSITLGNTTDNPSIRFANVRTSAPGDTLNAGEAMLSIIDAGSGTRQFHIRYYDGSTYRTATVNLA